MKLERSSFFAAKSCCGLGIQLFKQLEYNYSLSDLAIFAVYTKPHLTPYILQISSFLWLAFFMPISSVFFLNTYNLLLFLYVSYCWFSNPIMFSYKCVRTSISFKLIFHTKHFSSPFSRGTRRSSLSHADRNLLDDLLPILTFRSSNGCQASWQASVRISEGADNRGPNNRGSTVI